MQVTARLGEQISARPTKRVMASASTTFTPSQPSTTCSVTRRAASSRPKPGPMATACRQREPRRARPTMTLGSMRASHHLDHARLEGGRSLGPGARGDEPRARPHRGAPRRGALRRAFPGIRRRRARCPPACLCAFASRGHEVGPMSAGWITSAVWPTIGEDLAVGHAEIDHVDVPGEARAIGREQADLEVAEGDRVVGLHGARRGRHRCPRRDPRARRGRRSGTRAPRLISSTMTSRQKPAQGRSRPVPKSASTTKRAARSDERRELASPRAAPRRCRRDRCTRRG
jgi:hypothetical protein